MMLVATVNDVLADRTYPSPIVPRRRKPRRRTTRILLTFVACVLVLNALAGDRGLLATVSAGRAHGALSDDIATIREENAELREEVRRLREEPRAIEGIARRELGLIRPGERLFVVTDRPAPEPDGTPQLAAP